MMCAKKRTNKGYMLPLSAIVILIMALLTVTMTRTIKTSAHVSNHFDNLTKTLELAQIGLNKAIAGLSYDPDPLRMSHPYIKMPEYKGAYETIVGTRTVPSDPIYYIKTHATTTVKGKTYGINLHTYARISNVNKYFLAVSTGSVSISEGANIAEGMIYAPKLHFVMDGIPTNPSQILAAQFAEECIPPLPWDANQKNEVIITDSPFNQPEESSPLIFPQVLFPDLARLKVLAGPHTTTGTFSGHIYPPGFAEFNSASPPAGDNYRNHDTNNFHHIYYFDNEMTIGSSTIHGQVLFVSPEDIHIAGPIRVATHSAVLPGLGQVSSSTAHQAIFITKKSVIIDAALNFGATQFIQGLILAPNGTLYPTDYGDQTMHESLHLDFHGALIVNTLNTTPSLPHVFRRSRTYSYM
ncbi:hypothetical protein BVX98_01465, partial [bacterium F11]